MVDVYLPKTLRVENYRLKALYNLLLLLVVFGGCLVHFLFRSYRISVPLHVKPHMRIGTNSVKQVLDGVRGGKQHRLCSQAHQQEGLGRDGFMNQAWFKHFIRCNAICNYSTSTSGTLCASVQSAMFPHSSQDIFFAGSRHEWKVEPNVGRVVEWSAYPWIGDASVELTWNYATLQEPEWFPFIPQRSTQMTSAVEGSEKSVTSVLLDHSHRPHRILHGAPVLLQISELVSLIHDKSEYNGTFIDDSILMEGREILLTVHCYNDVSDAFIRKAGNVNIDDLTASSAHPLCLVYVSSSQSTSARTISAPIHAMLAGVHVLAPDTFSQMRFTNLTLVFVNLASFMFLLQLPRYVIKFIAIHLLGKLSLVYKNLLIEPVSASQLCVAWSVRLIQSAATFSALMRSKQNGSAADLPVLRETELELFLKQALGETKNNISSKEIHRIALLSITQSLKSRDAASKKKSLDISDFVHLCSAEGGALSHESMVSLLNGRRHIGKFEHFFMPAGLKHIVVPALPIATKSLRLGKTDVHPTDVCAQYNNSKGKQIPVLKSIATWESGVSGEQLPIEQLPSEPIVSPGDMPSQVELASDDWEILHPWIKRTLVNLLEQNAKLESHLEESHHALHTLQAQVNDLTLHMQSQKIAPPEQVDTPQTGRSPPITEDVKSLHERMYALETQVAEVFAKPHETEVKVAQAPNSVSCQTESSQGAADIAATLPKLSTEGDQESTIITTSDEVHWMQGASVDTTHHILPVQHHKGPFLANGALQAKGVW